MSDSRSSSDANGNFCDGVEQGPLNESVGEHNDLNISSNDLPDISLHDLSSNDLPDISLYDISSNDLPPEASDLELSSNDLPPESPEKNEIALLNRSSDFLPTESPKRISINGLESGDNLEQMMLEIGDIDESLSSPREVEDFRTAISNRDNLIKRLSTSLQHVLKERGEDAQITSLLEEEMNSLKVQVKLAVEKAAKNKSYRTRYTQLEKERDELNSNLNLVSAQLKLNKDSLQEKESALLLLESSLASIKSQTNQEIAQLKLEVQKTEERMQVESEEKLKKLMNDYEIKIQTQVEDHQKELTALEEKYEKELETMEDRYEEEQVVEFNLLDAELLSVREERNDLRERLDEIVSGTGALEFNKLQEEQNLLLKKAENEQKALVEKMLKLEKLYAEESSIRMSLEQNLNEVSSFLDETQYNAIPLKVRESIEKSLRLSCNFSRSRESLSQDGDNQSWKENLFPPANITQIESEDDVSFRSTDTETTPVHRPALQRYVDESDLVRSLKGEHEKEMSELRRYFENYCAEMERRYRNEFEEHLAHQRNLSSRQGTAPLSLEISQGQLDFSELESISPRSLDSSQLNSLGYQGPLSGHESDGYPSRHHSESNPSLHSRQNSDIPTQLQGSISKTGSPRRETLNQEVGKDSDSLHSVSLNLGGITQLTEQKRIQDLELVEREEEIVRLKEKVCLLEKALSSVEGGEGKCASCALYKETQENLKFEHNKELERIKEENKIKIQSTMEKLKKDLESDHMKKFDAVSKQIQQVQNSEIERIKARLKSEHSAVLEKVQLEHEQMLQDIKEAQTLEIEEVRRSFHSTEKSGLVSKPEPEVNPEIIEKLEKDLEKLEVERNQLKSMQHMMKNLITDLALHYNLSQKQIRFLSDSTFFESFFDMKSSDANETTGSNALHTPFKYFGGEGSAPESMNSSLQSGSQFSVLRDQEPQLVTPNQSFFSIDELSELMGAGSFLSVMENSEEIFQELRSQVQRSNEVLQTLEPGSLLTKISGLLTPPDSQESENFVGREAGRLEVEKARLELELAAAKQRLQEMELSGNRSVDQSEVISGLGGDISGEPEHNISVLDLKCLRELQDRAARLLGDTEGSLLPEQSREAVELLAELLMHTDQVINTAKLQVSDLSQQLDAADKQLRSTRGFLEEQAQEREAEREDWERKLNLALLQSRRRSEVREHGNEETDVGEQEDIPSSGKEEKRELTAAVEKIYQLREIIRTLETDLENKVEEERRITDEVLELRSALTESLLSQEAVHQELENIRSSSTDQELIDLVEGLKEQLNSKTQELQKHRAVHQHLHDVKAHLRGLQERVVLSTRELENSVSGRISTNSSRGSSPLLYNGGSFEDIGIGGAGLEIEEVSKLEKKLKILEKAETMAVNKVKSMDAEILNLKSEIKCLLEDKSSLSAQLEEVGRTGAQTQQTISSLRKDKINLEKELKELRGHNFEDLQAENAILQSRVVSLQVQVSTLQGEKQASKHRFPVRGDATEIILQEKEKISLHLEQTLDKLKIIETEKDLVEQRCAGLSAKIERLEQEIESQGLSLPESDKLLQLERDKSELEEVNAKLLKELGQARAAELNAHKLQIPRLAEDLLKEKNCEIDRLRFQLSELQVKSQNMLQSTPNSWTSSLDHMSRSSVEQLREAPRIQNLSELSFVMNRRDVVNQANKVSVHNLDTIHETSLTLREPSSHFSTTPGTVRESSYDTSNSGTTGETSHVGTIQRIPLGETKSGSLNLSAPEVELTRDTAKDGTEERINHDDIIENELISSEEVSALLNQKAEEIETLSSIIHEKDSYLYELQDKVQDSEERIKSLEKDLSEINKTLKQKNEFCKNLEQIVSEKTEKVETLENAVNILRTEVEEKESQCIRLKQDIIDKDEVLSSYEDKLQDRQDKLRDLENKQLQDIEPNLAEEVKRLREELNDRVSGMENLHSIIQKNERDLQRRIEAESELKRKCSELNKNLETKIQFLAESSRATERLKSDLESAQNNLEDEAREKLKLETELSKVTKEMSSIERVVKEMTTQFKREVETRDQEISRLNLKYQDIEKKQYDALRTLEQVQSSPSAKSCEKCDAKLHSVDNGSLDDLTTLVERELEKSSELDRSLLTQLVSGNTTLNTTQDDISEVERLLRKVQQDGVKVLTLSEKLFLTKHSQDENPNEDGRLREVSRKLELMQFEIEQERVVSEDLRRSLESEKKNGLELFSKLSSERKLKNGLEEELSGAQRQIRTLLKEKSRNHQMIVDSDNEEFLNTIELQKQQIESLEESLRMEKDNFSQLQNVLAVERRRALKTEYSQERRDEEDIEELRNQLRAERNYRDQLESRQETGKSGEVAKLIIDQLNSELRIERKKNSEVSLELEKMKRNLQDGSQFRFQRAESVQISDRGAELDQSWNRAWRSRELELERLVASLELRTEMIEREDKRKGLELDKLKLELSQRERNNSGLSKEQLERMKQVNSFLEHNLKENGEMLATISKLQEERHELKSKLAEHKYRQETCSCSGPGENRQDLYSRYLRTESYRKALIWQKRYLLVHISGGYFSREPVLRVGRQNLSGINRFRAAVYSVTSILRMKYLIRRWSSGKRAGVTPSRSRAWSSALSSSSVPEMKTPTQRRPESLDIRFPAHSGLHPVYSPRLEQRSRVRRTSSLREQPRRSLESPSSLSSSSSIHPPPVVTGRTPPTRDIGARRQRSSEPSAGDHHTLNNQPRRSLGFQEQGSTIRDPELVADLKDYQEKLESLERQLGIKF